MRNASRGIIEAISVKGNIFVWGFFQLLSLYNKSMFMIS